MSDHRGNPVLAFFGLDGANAGATLRWVLPIMLVPVLGMVGASVLISLFKEVPLAAHAAAIGFAALIAFFTLARLRAAYMISSSDEDNPQ